MGQYYLRYKKKDTENKYYFAGFNSLDKLLKYKENYFIEAYEANIFDSKAGGGQSHMENEKLKRIDVLKDQIIACQQEKALYNNTFISSAIICSILTAAATLANDRMENPIASAVLYGLPVIYFMVLFNLLKYTGVQVSLGAYRYTLENEINTLMGGNKLSFWEFSLVKRQGPYIFIDGVGQIVFFLPPVFIFAYKMYMVPDKGFIWRFWAVVYALEALVCFAQAANLVDKLNKDRESFETYIKE